MADEEKVGSESETSGETASETKVEGGEGAEDATETAGSATEPKAGDACTCPDGRPGTLHDQEGTLVCLANQG